MHAGDHDVRLMMLAVATARLGLGRTAPNPSVGAVVVEPGSHTIISRARTSDGGRPHAETQALKDAGARAAGATLYVTLEPCAHVGETPPCVENIIAAGISRVVVGIQDPDPRVAGQGMSALRRAGIRVESGLAGRDAMWVTRGHCLRVSEQRPFVQIKMALGADGKVPLGQSGKPTWATGTTARAFGHLLRSEADAIVIGGATLRDDNPDLTCRLPGLERTSPIRIVVTADHDALSKSRLFETRDTVPLWVAVADPSGETVREANQQMLADMDSLRQSSDAGGSIDCKAFLAELANRGITRLLVEGGPSLWRWFAAAGAVDEVNSFVAGCAATDPGMDEQGRQLVSAQLGCDPGPLTSARTVGTDAWLVFRSKP